MITMIIKMFSLFAGHLAAHQNPGAEAGRENPIGKPARFCKFKETTQRRNSSTNVVFTSASHCWQHLRGCQQQNKLDPSLLPPPSHRLHSSAIKFQDFYLYYRVVSILLPKKRSGCCWDVGMLGAGGGFKTTDKNFPSQVDCQQSSTLVSGWKVIE